MMSKEEIRAAEDRAVRFMSEKATYQEVSSYYFESEDTAVLSAVSYVCHAPIRNAIPFNTEVKPRILAFATNCDRYHRPDARRDEAVDAYYYWVTDPWISPWRNLLNDQERIQTIEKDGRRVGILVPRSALDNPEITWRMIFNFVSAVRTPAEGSPNIRFWFEAVKNFGLTPEEAYYLCYSFTVDTDGRVQKVYLNSNHFPISIHRGFSYQKFKNAQPDTTTRGGMSDLWDHPEKAYASPFDFSPVFRNQQTSFSNVTWAPMKDIIDYYKERYQKSFTNDE